jgi:peroxiredoxin Q/BCP
MRFRIIISALILGFIGLVFYSQFTKPKTLETQSKGDFGKLIGKSAPDFTLPSYKGSPTSLSSLRGKKVVLFFNEGIVCYPACWNQVAALGTDKGLNNDQIATVSIVPDQRDEWIKAVKQQPDLGKETLLLDVGAGISKSYGVLDLESSMHKYEKPGHTYVVLDQKGVVRYTFDDPTMAIQNDRIKKELAKI